MHEADSVLAVGLHSGSLPVQSDLFLRQAHWGPEDFQIPLKKKKKILFILFLERGEGREKETERNIK